MTASVATVMYRHTLIVDELEEADMLCYGDGLYEVVSADGTMFKPNGIFSGA